VDIASPSRRRLPIYQLLGVPEVWVWQADSLTVHVLSASGSYEERSESFALAGFPISTAEQLLNARHTMSENDLMRRFREAVRG
jgi:hypothetical protein